MDEDRRETETWNRMEDEFGREVRNSPTGVQIDHRAKRPRSPSPSMLPPIRFQFRDDAPRDPYYYQPRYDRRDDPYYRQPPAPYYRSYPEPPPPRVPPPESVNYLVTYRHFSDHIQDVYPEVYEDRRKLEEAWQNYRSSFYRKFYRSFFDDHSKKAWFREKYDPAEDALRTRLRTKGREGKLDKFLTALQNGEFDSLTLDWSTASKKTDKPHVEAEAEAKAVLATDQVKTEEPATQAPKEEDTNGAEDFKPVVPNTSVESKAEEANAGDALKSDQSREDVVVIPADEHQFVIKAVAADISRTDLEQHLGQVDGFHSLALCDPIPTKRFQRVAFVNFLPGTDMKKAEETLFESKLNEFTLHMTKSDSETLYRMKHLAAFYGDVARLELDLVQLQKLIELVETESADTRGSQAISEKTTANEEALLKKAENDEDKEKAKLTALKFQVDLRVQYLRDAFNTCYYCAASCDFPEELSRKCGKHVRRTGPPAADDPKGRSNREKDLANARIFDDKLAMLLRPDTVNILEVGGDSYDDELTRQCDPHLTTEEEGKFRCRSCGKLFRGKTFVEKHLLNKHSDLLKPEILEEVKYFNAYVLDPCKIIPDMPEHPSKQDRRGGSMRESHSAGPYGASMQYYSNGYDDASRGRRLTDRIGDRIQDDRPAKRPRPSKPLEIPAGVRQDPRAGRLASYNDLDSQVPSGSGDAELELDY